MELSWMMIMVFSLKMGSFSIFVGKTVVRFFTSMCFKSRYCIPCTEAWK